MAEKKFHGLLVTTPPPEHPFRQQLEKTEGFVDVRICVLPPAHAYHSPNHPCVVALLALESALQVIVCDAGGPTRREKLDPYQLLELPSYAPYFFTLRSPPNANAMFAIGHKYLANTHAHERAPPVDAVAREPLAFPYLRKGETFRMIVGEEAAYYGGATCLLVGILAGDLAAVPQDNATHEVVSRVVWQESAGSWAVVHHANGVLQEKQRDRAAFSKNASREMLLNAARFCMKDGNEIEFVSVFLVFADLLAPIAGQDMLRDMAQRYAGIVGKVMTDKSDGVPRALREAVMRAQDAMARKQASASQPASTKTGTQNSDSKKGAKNADPKTETQNADTKKEMHSADAKNETQNTDNKCAIASCVKKDNLRRCGGCKKVYYCSVDHQKEHWGIHKPNCKV
eukprot:Phypoly_transcript_11232.p1 GENE.Phypoly_transcript_11232~~Phypoly_transcript_11232.p1  ORF type:complete len:411 (+),score=117.62 Phypoly_transcript_11232:38-1234(+)